MTDQGYMQRALMLARNGLGFASPNPMVGAVIVAPDGRVIGEGWHRRCGEAHAEVNAVASVSDADRKLLPKSTIYVTLEPCSHYGKTPPCANLLIECGFSRVVVATVDPFAKVSGRGIAMLRDAGAQVDVGILGKEARDLNRKFFTAHTLHRPYITLKWAQSADGFMDSRRSADNPHACRFSNDLSSVEVMKMRATHDAILTTSATVLADNPRLNLRNYDGRQPRVFVLDHKGALTGRSDLNLVEEMRTNPTDPRVIILSEQQSLALVMARLYDQYGITSLLTEAGPTLLNQLLTDGLYDEIHRETSPVILGAEGTHPAPHLPSDMALESYTIGQNLMETAKRNID